MNRSIPLVSLLSLLALTACTEGMICTASVEPAVIVEIRDAVGDQPLDGDAVGWVREGTFGDSLRAYGVTLEGALVSRAGADEREGTYVVQVSHAGYAEWEQSDVRVRSDGCHVETAHLLARLVRVP